VGSRCPRKAVKHQKSAQKGNKQKKKWSETQRNVPKKGAHACPRCRVCLKGHLRLHRFKTPPKSCKNTQKVPKRAKKAVRNRENCVQKTCTYLSKMQRMFQREYETAEDQDPPKSLKNHKKSAQSGKKAVRSREGGTQKRCTCLSQMWSMSQRASETVEGQDPPKSL
jgi:hypothetical protein